MAKRGGKEGIFESREREIARESHPSWQIREDQASTQSELSQTSLSFPLSLTAWHLGEKSQH